MYNPSWINEFLFKKYTTKKGKVSFKDTFSVLKKSHKTREKYTIKIREVTKTRVKIVQFGRINIIILRRMDRQSTGRHTIASKTMPPAAAT